MLTELLDQILEDPCFNTLRTQEQLGKPCYCITEREYQAIFIYQSILIRLLCIGYIVTSGAVLLHGVIGFRVLIQSSKSSSFVEKRIENFLLEKLVSKNSFVFFFNYTYFS